ncbi:MAG: flagellar FliJ family protein [Helicobacteraceae bacterium]|nr:flagellar FliJ family protein [Candidatus Sulfurimonas ponti]MBL6973084.1 flagellar FliJ family protein [Sulfurimonas sp.]
MKTRYSSLVTLKKSAVQGSEQALQSANATLNTATMELQLAYDLLDSIKSPQTGSISQLTSSRSLMESQRGVIKHNQEWVYFAKEQVELAKMKLKADMIEYEKFHYLELEEVKKKLKEIKIQEAKDLDEVALMTYSKKNDKQDEE